MNDNSRSISRLLTLGALAGIMTCGIQLHAQQGSMPSQAPGQPSQAQPGQTPDQGQMAPGSQSGQMSPGADASAPAPAGQMIMGTVVKTGDKYQLKDDTSGTTYDLDHQSEVAKFEGKKVRVRGVVDPATKTIHLQ